MEMKPSLPANLPGETRDSLSWIHNLGLGDPFIPTDAAPFVRLIGDYQWGGWAHGYPSALPSLLPIFRRSNPVSRASSRCFARRRRRLLLLLVR